MRPRFILRAVFEYVLQCPELLAVIVEEFTRDLFNIEGMIVAIQDRQRRNAEQIGFECVNIKQRQAIHGGAFAFVRLHGDAPEDAALARVLVILDVDEVPMALVVVAEDEQGVGERVQQPVNDLTFWVALEFTRQLPIDDLEVAVLRE